jgi:uncharacterized protein YbaP (TraB family)
MGSVIEAGTTTRRSIIVMLGALGVASVVRGQAIATAGPPLYVAQRGGAKVSIFGGFLATDRTWLTPTIEAAVNESRELWQEDPPTPPAFDPAVMDALSRRTEGTLFDDITTGQADRVLRIAQTVGIQREVLETLRPWAAGSRLAFRYFQNPATARLPYDDMQGALVGIAEAKGIPVRSEWADWHDFSRLLAGSSKAAQVQYLLYTLDNIDRPVEQETELTAAWLKGDVSGLERAVNENLRNPYPDLYAKIETERNTQWAIRVEDMLARGGAYFINVGVYHTVGPDSIQACVRRRGITVQRA